LTSLDHLILPEASPTATGTPSSEGEENFWKHGALGADVGIQHCAKLLCCSHHFWKTLACVNSYSDICVSLLLCCSPHHSQPAMTSGGLEILPAEVLGRYQSHEKPDGSLVAQNLCKKWMCWEKKSMLKFEVHSGSS
jgi:hypothetical protein